MSDEGLRPVINCGVTASHSIVRPMAAHRYGPMARIITDHYALKKAAQRTAFSILFVFQVFDLIFQLIDPLHYAAAFFLKTFFQHVEQYQKETADDAEQQIESVAAPGSESAVQEVGEHQSTAAVADENDFFDLVHGILLTG